MPTGGQGGPLLLRWGKRYCKRGAALMRRLRAQGRANFQKFFYDFIHTVNAEEVKQKAQEFPPLTLL